MSFTTDIIDELLALPRAKTCCRKALLSGLLYGSRSLEGGVFETEFIVYDVAALASELLGSMFSSKGEVISKRSGRREVYVLSYRSKAIGNILSQLDDETDASVESIVAFRCEGCISSFLRGVFMSSMTVSDPTRSYHMEIKCQRRERAKKLSDLLERHIAKPSLIERSKGFGLYYKSNGKISDALCFVGGARSGFFTANVSIENDIRNNENRATNCVARNISRSVNASMKHVEAIRRLKESHRFESLSEELRYTAELREENPSASLSELAMIHEPPISKSGLNRRLTLILEAVEDK